MLNWIQQTQDFKSFNLDSCQNCGSQCSLSGLGAQLSRTKASPVYMVYLGSFSVHMCWLGSSRFDSAQHGIKSPSLSHNPIARICLLRFHFSFSLVTPLSSAYKDTITHDNGPISCLKKLVLEATNTASFKNIQYCDSNCCPLFDSPAGRELSAGSQSVAIVFWDLFYFLDVPRAHLAEKARR